VSEARTVSVRPTGLTDDEERRLAKLLGPAQAGDAKALAELRPLLDKAGIWRHVGDLAQRVEDAWLEAMTGRNKLAREGYGRRADELRRELLAAGDSPLERLLVERVVACWLQVAHADISYASLLQADSHAFRQGDYYLARQDRAHARFLQATRALATVRRLLVPAVQVNVGRNQVIAQHAGSPSAGGPDDADDA
jgi:hypothetical protein